MGSIFIVISFVTIIWSLLTSFAASGKSKESITSIFEGLGFSASCIASALASCETSPNLTNLINPEITERPSSLHQAFVTTNVAKNCDELLAKGDTASGVRTIYPYECCRERKVTVYCDQETDGGGWTVFQNRDALTKREDFYRTWVEYVLGFGNVTGEFWLGLDNIHALVSSSLMELRVDLVDYDDVKRWAKYGVFYVGDSPSKYKLSVGRYSGDATDQLAYHNERKFSALDQDNDDTDINCAVKYRGAWWYGGCHNSNLNGYQYVGQHATDADGINWLEFRGHRYSLKKASLKLRTSFRF